MARTTAKSHACHGGQSPRSVTPPPVTQQGSHHANGSLGKPGTNCFYSRPPCTANLSAPWGPQSSSNVQIFLCKITLTPFYHSFFPLSLSLAHPFSGNPTHALLLSMLWSPHSIARNLWSLSLFITTLLCLCSNWLPLEEGESLENGHSLLNSLWVYGPGGMISLYVLNFSS